MSTPTATPSNPAAKTRTDRWPSQVRFILGNEAAERFSYYGMKGILAIYITSVLLKTKDQATGIIHLFGFANYFMPLLGAWISDRLWGRYHTILWISLSYCIGHGVMALSDVITTVDGKVMCLYVGLGLIAFGSGGIKPCVSAFMGDQFRSDQRHLLQKAYAAFYWSINLGSTASFILIPFIRKEFGYGWAFGVPGLAMGFATLVFWIGTRKYVRVAPAGDPKWLYKVFWFFMMFVAILLAHAIGTALHMATWQCVILDVAAALAVVGWMTKQFLKEVDERAEKAEGAFFATFWYAFTKPVSRKSGEGFWDVARARFTDSSVEAAKSVWPILGVFALVPIFWSLFDQTFSTWVLQGEMMKPSFVGPSRLKPRHVKNVDPVVNTLSAGTNVMSALLWSRFTDTQRQLLTNTNAAAAERKTVLLDGLNKFIDGTTTFDAGSLASLPGTQALARAKFSTDTLFLLWTQPTGEEVLQVKRLILEDYFPEDLKKVYRIGPEEMLSANPILVMLFVPILTLMVYPVLGRFASPLRRMSYGMFLAAASFVIVAWLQEAIDDGQKLSVWWQVAPYIVLTIAEVLVSTTGLEFAFREAAPSMKSTIMGFWNLTVALGNIFVTFITALAGSFLGEGGGHDVSVSPTMFLFYAGLTFFVAIAFSSVAAFYKYRDPTAAAGK